MRIGDKDQGVPEASVGDGPVSCPSRPPRPELQLPSTTNHKKVALKGTAKGAAKVTVTGPDGKPQTAAVTKDSFCVMLSLEAVTTPQKFTVVSRDAAGCASPEATATITYNKSFKMVNVLRNIKGQSLKAPVKGSLAALTDGQMGGVVTMGAPTSTSFCGTSDYNYLWFDLGAVRVVDEVDIRYPKNPPTADYLSCWILLGSTQASPAAPTAASYPGWTKLYSSQDEKAASPVVVDIFDTKVRHLALILLEDNDLISQGEFFELTEIEAWGLPVEPKCN